MSEAVAFRIYTDAELETLSSAISLHVNNGLDDWIVDQIPVRCNVANAFDKADVRRRNWQIDARSVLHLGRHGYAHYREKTREQLVGMFLRMPSELAKPDPKEIDTLISQFGPVLLGGQEGFNGRASDSEISKAFVRGRGWIAAEIEIGDAQISLLLTPVFAASKLKPHTLQRRSTTLQSRHAAIADKRVSLSVELGTATVSIGELQQLQVGDVITLNKLFTEALNVVNAEGKFVCAGNLGQREGQRAVMLCGK